MDIIASMLAYVVCMTGLVTGLVMSFVVFFSAPGQQAPAPARAAVMTRPGSAPINKLALKEFPVTPVGSSHQAKERQRPASDAAAAGAAVAPDAQQKPLSSQSRLRRLAEKERARQLAYRERSSFEARFLHYDD